MEPKARQVHVRRDSAAVQDGENVAQLLNMFWRYVSGRSTIVESLEAAMFERSDHFVNL